MTHSVTRVAGKRALSVMQQQLGCVSAISEPGTECFKGATAKVLTVSLAELGTQGVGGLSPPVRMHAAAFHRQLHIAVATLAAFVRISENPNIQTFHVYWEDTDQHAGPPEEGNRCDNYWKSWHFDWGATTCHLDSTDLNSCRAFKESDNSSQTQCNSCLLRRGADWRHK